MTNRVLLSVAGAVVVLAVGIVGLLSRSHAETASATEPTGSCPATDSAWAAARPGNTQVMVPDTPSSVLICYYAAPERFGGPPRKLARSAALPQAQAGDLARTLNTFHTGPIRCPLLRTPLLGMRFHYATGPDATVMMGIGGCWAVTNGGRTVTAGPVTIPGFGHFTGVTVGSSTPPTPR